MVSPMPMRPPNSQYEAYNQSISLQSALFPGVAAQPPVPASSSSTSPLAVGAPTLAPGGHLGVIGGQVPWIGGNMVMSNVPPHCAPSGYIRNNPQPIQAAPVLGPAQPAQVPNQLTLGPSPGPGAVAGIVSMSSPPVKRCSLPPPRQQVGDANHVVWGGIDLDSQDSMAPFYSGGISTGGTPHNSTSGIRARKKIQNRRMDDVLFLDSMSDLSSAGTMIDDYGSHGFPQGLVHGDPQLPTTFVREETEVEDGHLRGTHFGEGLECDNSEDEEDSDGDDRQQQEEQMARQREFESQGLDIEALLKQVPRNDDGTLTSIGSIGHDTGECKAPCVFAMRKRGCMNGTQCNFCHLPHKVKRQRQKHKARPRPCKGKRDRYRKHWEELKTQIEAAPDTFDPEQVELPASISTYEKLKAKLVTRLKTHKSNVIAERGGSVAEEQAP